MEAKGGVELRTGVVEKNAGVRGIDGRDRGSCRCWYAVVDYLLCRSLMQLTKASHRQGKSCFE